MSTSQEKATLRLNSIASEVRFLLCTVLWLWLSKFLISHLGITDYGLWALIGMVTGYLGLADLGITQALVRYIAEYQTTKDHVSINKYINTSVVLYLVIALVLVSAALILKSLILKNVLALNITLIPVASNILVISAASMGLLLIGGIFRSVLEGMQKLVASNIIIFLQTLLLAVGSFIAIKSNYGLIGLAINTLVVYSLSLIMFFLTARFYFRQMNIKLIVLNKRDTLKLLSYSLNIQASSLLGIGYQLVIKVILTRFVSLGYVGLYDISTRLLDAIKGIFTSLVLPILPLSSSLNKSKGKDHLAWFSSLVNTYMLLMALPTFIGVWVFVPQIFSLWLGTFNSDLIWSTRWLIVPFFGSTIITNIYLTFQGIGLARWNVLLHLINFVIGIPCVLIAARIGGYGGIIVSLTITLMLPSIAAMVLYKHYFKPAPLWRFRNATSFAIQSTRIFMRKTRSV